MSPLMPPHIQARFRLLQLLLVLMACMNGVLYFAGLPFARPAISALFIVLAVMVLWHMFFLWRWSRTMRRELELQAAKAYADLQQALLEAEVQRAHHAVHRMSAMSMNPREFRVQGPEAVYVRRGAEWIRAAGHEPPSYEQIGRDLDRIESAVQDLEAHGEAPALPEGPEAPKLLPKKTGLH